MSKNIKWQALLLAFFILVSVSLTQAHFGGSAAATATPPAPASPADASSSLSALSYDRSEGSALSENVPPQSETLPTRKWDVLDPQIDAQAALIQTLDENFPFLHYRTYQPWPLASLTKLMTAVVVLEDVGANKKIPISQTAVDTEGTAGDLQSGEVYTAEDLLKVMLITSSNDAATAFEEYVGGRDKFVLMMNNKAQELGMTNTTYHDASGLSPLDMSTANDMLLLTEYIVKEHPEIFSWTRITSLIVQPLNNPQSKALTNIDFFSFDAGFLGGKTGTTDEAKQNMLEVISMGRYRVVVIVLGADNRYTEVPKLLNWVEEAYTFPQ